MSIPAAIFSAAFVTVVEVVGGVLVILGALLTVVAACYLVVMVGAAVFVHIPNGIFVQDGGWELVGAIAAVLLALAAAGSGRYGLDAVLRRRQAQGFASIEATAPTEEMAAPAPRNPVAEARIAAFFDARSAAGSGPSTSPEPLTPPAGRPPTEAGPDAVPEPVQRRRSLWTGSSVSAPSPSDFSTNGDADRGGDRGATPDHAG